MFNNKSKENIVSISPKNHGWYEVKLNQQELDYVWTVSYTHLRAHET